MDNIRLKYCFVLVLDHEAALTFYRDALGLEVRNDVAYENLRWVTLGSPGQPDAEIVLESPAASPDVSPADRKAVEELIAKGLMRAVVFAVDDVDATFERVRASGAEVLQEPIDQGYGVRDCAFRDPSGNLIRINQKI
jgi:catechol 2,3-dioxygenase-like lactoylglutathione lyase family enzyme